MNPTKENNVTVTVSSQGIEIPAAEQARREKISFGFFVFAAIVLVWASRPRRLTPWPKGIGAPKHFRSQPSCEGSVDRMGE